MRVKLLCLSVVNKRSSDMALSVDGCRLCLCVASSLDAPVVLCDSVPSFAARPKTDDDAYQKCITVAEVLKKHFWFEVPNNNKFNQLTSRFIKPSSHNHTP